MSPALSFNLDQSKIIPSGNWLTLLSKSRVKEMADAPQYNLGERRNAGNQ